MPSAVNSTARTRWLSALATSRYAVVCAAAAAALATENSPLPIIEYIACVLLHTLRITVSSIQELHGPTGYVSDSERRCRRHL